MQHTTKSEKETLDLAKKYAKKLKGGETIGLIGDLGAGKTVFTKGLAKSLGVKKVVTSPTFVLLKPYKTTGNKNIKFLCHIDAYRIKSAQDIISIGAEDYFSDKDTVTVVEWADKIKKVLPKETKFINFKIYNNKRVIIL